MSTKVETTIRGKPVTIFVGRNRGRYTVGAYKKFVENIVQCMTDEQILNVIQFFNGRKFLALDEVLACFEYNGYWEECPGKCICGKLIQYEYYIQNTQTLNYHILGSTCITPFATHSVYHYTESARMRTLRKCFGALKEGFTQKKEREKIQKNNDLKFRRGKYKNHTVRAISRIDPFYCLWYEKTTDDIHMKWHINDVLYDLPQSMRYKIALTRKSQRKKVLYCRGDY